MKPAPGVWGLDLGQCALKALRLQEVDGTLTATAFDYVEYPKILSQPDADPDQLIREALEQFLSRNDLRGDTVAIAVPGQSGLARFVKLPPVEEKKIADIVKFEAKQQIPFNLDEVVWDFQKLGAGNVVDGFALETEIGLFAMKRDMINRYVQHFKDVKVEVHIIQMAPLALANFVSFDLLNKDPNTPTEGKGPAVAALDIGTDSSNLVVTDGGKIIWQRPIPLGGNHFTRALTKELKLTFAKAEHLKRNATKSGAPELKKILAALKPVLNDFVGEVQRSLGYFTNTHRDATIEYMVGLGNAFRLPGLQRFLAEKLQLEVRKLDKMTRLTGDALNQPIYQENILSFGVAYGLAVQGLTRARLVTNLLPNEIRVERLIRAKKPWAAAAAGLLLAGLGAAALGNYLDITAYKNRETQAAMERADKVAKRAAAAHAAFESAKKSALSEEESVKAIVAGDYERKNWLQLFKFVGDSIPQPDGTNLPEQVRPLYWTAVPPPRKGQPRYVSGEQAYGLFKNYTRLAARDKVKDKAKEKSKVEEPTDPLPEGIDSLVQFQVESIDARFVDDLPAFWKKATKDKEVNDVDIRGPKNTDGKAGVKPPEGKGWVVEVAGFTYHHSKEAFIRDTFLNVLAQRGMTPPPPKVEPKPPETEDKPQDGDKEKGKEKDKDKDKDKVDEKPQDKPPEKAEDKPPVPADDPNNKPAHPVRGLVTHVLLYKQVSKPSDGTTAGYEIIQTSALDSLTGGSGAGGLGSGGMASAGGKGAADMMAAYQSGGMTSGESAVPKVNRSSWKALGSRSGGTAGMGMGGMTGPGGPMGPGSGMYGQGTMPRPGSTPMPRSGGTGTGGGSVAGEGLPGGGTGLGSPRTGDRPTTTGSATAKYTRTEFVILFIWREPTPSDTLRGGLAGSAEGGGATGEGSGTGGISMGGDR